MNQPRAVQSPVLPADVVRAVSVEVSRLARGGLSDTERATQIDKLASLYGEQTDVRHPFAPTGDTPLRTRAEIRQHFEQAGSSGARIDRWDVVDGVVHTTDDPEAVVYEYAYAMTVDGRDATVRMTIVARVRNGLIVESRDYGDHVAMARAFGRLGELASALTDAARPRPSGRSAG